MPGTTIVPFSMDKLHTYVTFAFINDRDAPVMLWATFSRRLINSLRLAERNTDPHHSHSVHVLMILECRNRPETNSNNNKSNIGQEEKEGLVLLVTLISGENKYATVFGEVFQTLK